MNALMPANATEWLTFVLVVLTGVYAIVTLFILKANRAAVDAMREQTEALLRPYVAVEVTTRPGTTLVHLVVSNTGKSAAHQLVMTIDKRVPMGMGAQDASLNDLPLFSGTERVALAAGAEIEYILGVGHEIFPGTSTRPIPEHFTVSAEYSFGERRYVEHNVIDIRPLRLSSVKHDQIATAVEKGTEKVAKAVDALRRDIATLMRPDEQSD